jgi:hemerythrin
MDELQSELKNIIFLAISITRTEMELSSKVSHCMRNRIFFPQWSDTLTCFLKKIDQQHQQMIQSFANYAMKLNSQKSFDEVKKMLRELQYYSTVHFKTEEAYMKKVNYPLRSEHLESHQEFLQQFKDMLIEYSAKKDVERVKDWIAGFLNWFLNHVREKDIKMGFFVKVKKFSTIKKNRLLLYFDSQTYADHLKEALNDIGFEAIATSQIENEAFDWISTGDISACLISSDKPNFSGIGLLQKTRKNNLNIPIILLSLKENQVDLKKNIKKLRLDHKANLFLMRPFSIESLIYRLDQLLFPSFSAGKG